MIGPELQLAQVAALKATPAFCGGRIYDNPPDAAERIKLTGAAFPYVTLGEGQVIDDGNSCADGWGVYSDFHIFSRPDAKSKLEAKALAADLVARMLALDGVADFSVTIAALEAARFLRDPDGITEHGVVTMRFLLNPA